MRGVEAELQGGLVGGQTEVREKVTDLPLGGVDDLTGRGPVDGGGHVQAELLEVAAHLVEEVLGRKLRLVVHGILTRGEGDSPPHALSGG